MSRRENVFLVCEKSKCTLKETDKLCICECCKDSERERERMTERPRNRWALAGSNKRAWRMRPNVWNQSVLCLPPQGWGLFNTGMANKLVKSTSGAHEVLPSLSTNSQTHTHVPGVLMCIHGRSLEPNTSVTCVAMIETPTSPWHTHTHTDTSLYELVFTPRHCMSLYWKSKKTQNQRAKIHRSTLWKDHIKPTTIHNKK